MNEVMASREKACHLLNYFAVYMNHTTVTFSGMQCSRIGTSRGL